MLSKYEQETIINFNEDEPNATCYTYNKALQRKLDGLCLKSKGIALVREGEGWKEYSFPKKWVKVNQQKQYSDEQRQVMAERARERFGKKEWSKQAV